LQFPRPFEHAHPPVRDVNEIELERLTVGQRAADRLAAVVGSWWFIGIQSAIVVAWAGVNLAAWIRHWGPYPFILMNLFLSLQAAYTAPMLMMSQNRLAVRDRLEAHNDYEINRKAEEEVRAVLDHLTAQDLALTKIVEALAARMNGSGQG
jgi:uncharacterized membrane protein